MVVVIKEVKMTDFVVVEKVTGLEVVAKVVKVLG